MSGHSANKEPRLRAENREGQQQRSHRRYGAVDCGSVSKNQARVVSIADMERRRKPKLEKRSAAHPREAKRDDERYHRPEETSYVHHAIEFSGRIDVCNRLVAWDFSSGVHLETAQLYVGAGAVSRSAATTSETLGYPVLEKGR